MYVLCSSAGVFCNIFQGLINLFIFDIYSIYTLCHIWVQIKIFEYVYNLNDILNIILCLKKKIFLYIQNILFYIQNILLYIQNILLYPKCSPLYSKCFVVSVYLPLLYYDTRVIVLSAKTSLWSFVDVCQLPSKLGRCRSFKVKWFHNSTTRSCMRFWYGGCDGNGNNFDTKEDCEARCLSSRTGKQQLHSSCLNWFLSHCFYITRPKHQEALPVLENSVYQNFSFKLYLRNYFKLRFNSLKIG